MLRGEDLREVDWRDAKLVGADLSGALLYGADLSNADLTGALLVGADLYGATLCGAVLRDADLRDAKIRAVDLNDADLTGADLSDAKLNRGGRGGRNNPRRRTDLLGAKLVRANLSRANLSRALLVRVDLTGADLRDAILRGAVLHLASRHDYAPMLPCFADWIGRLQRFKWLQHFQIFDARYLVTLDGSRYFSSELVSCERCLSTTTDGIERHHHDILQAAIVHPDKRVVLPLAPEFILNSDGRGGEYHKQDCEINAGYRMLERLRADYPRIRKYSVNRCGKGWTQPERCAKK